MNDERPDFLGYRAKAGESARDPDRWHPEMEIPDATANITVEEGAVLLTFSAPYLIDLDRIPDQAALIEWVLHLEGKAWMHDPGHPGLRMQAFIKAVCSAKGWPVYTGV